MQPLFSLRPFCATMHKAAWQISQLLTTFLTIAVIPGQYHVSCSRLMVLATPEWANACVCHIALSRNEGGHMAHHRGLLWGEGGAT